MILRLVLRGCRGINNSSRHLSEAIIDTSPSVEKGLIFTRDYATPNGESEDFEKKVIEIGRRNSIKKETTPTVADYVKNRNSKEPQVGALVYIGDGKRHALTDDNGFFNLNVPYGKNQLLVRSQGMKSTTRNVIVLSSGNLNIDMEEDVILLDEVSISSERDKNVLGVQAGIDRIVVEEVKTVPLVLGEEDILKIATTKSGVQTLGEGASGFNVRGGKADQNLILINGSPVYNPNHFFGFFSVFNSDAISDMQLYKSSIPASFGGRLSSIFDITSKKADSEKIEGKAGISPVTSKLTLELPLVKDKTDILISGRATYSDWLLRNVRNAAFSENEVSFFDFLLRVDHVVNERNSLTFSSYVSGDDFKLRSDTLFSLSQFSFQNKNASLKWNRIFSPKLDARFSAGAAHYGYDLTNDETTSSAFSQDFGTTEYWANADFAYYANDDHELGFGLQSKFYKVNPGSKKSLGEQSTVIDEILSREQGIEHALYISDNYKVTDKISYSGGLRYTLYHALGSADILQYEPGLPRNSNTVIDSTSYGAGEIIQTYQGLEWRISGRYAFNNSQSLKMAINRTRQYIHVLSNSAALSPTDTWKLSDTHLRPQVGDQLSLGYYQNLSNGKVEVSVETYYKRFQNLVDFKTNANFLLKENVEQVTLQGPGKSYGIEFSLNKKGKLNGWFNYAYARSFIKHSGIFAEETVNQGAFFPTNYDKPHNINLVSNYKVTHRFSVSFNATFNSGRPVTLPVAIFDFKDTQNLHFSDRNEFRIPNYFRLDLGVNLEGNHKIKKLAHSFWSFSIYNLTGRDNPFSVFFDVDEEGVRGSQLIIFG
ncbi:MAG: TonB-dependent receptor, partial [Ekhidna sp.]|nr:TonB-dependent receptor [Ekhidna sp.]